MRVKYGYELVNDRASSSSTSIRQLNPEERRRRAELAEQQAVLDRAAEQRKRNDAQMLAAYPDRGVVQDARSRKISTARSEDQHHALNLRSQEKALTELLGPQRAISNAPSSQCRRI